MSLRKWVWLAFVSLLSCAPPALARAVPEKEITAFDGVRGDDLGISVSTSGDVAIVGARLDDDNDAYSGSAYFFDLSCGNGLIDGLEPCDDGNSTGGDGCSPTCTVENGYICDVSEPSVCADIDECDLGNDDCPAGATCTNTLGGFVCGCRSPEQKITAFDGMGGDYFGRSVSISGDVAIVGADKDDDNGTDSGSAYVYRQIGRTWTLEKKLTASDGASGDSLGLSVSISGDVAIVGAYLLDDDNGGSSGSAYIYQRDFGGANNWGEVTKLTALASATEDYFGRSVSISGDVAIVGAGRNDDNGIESGSAYVYQRDQGGADTWGEVTKLAASDGVFGDRFGWSVSVSGGVAIVAAYRDDDKGARSGSAYIYWRDHGGVNNWGELAKLTASDGATDHYFGSSVSVSGDVAIVGAIGDNDNGSRSGSAYIYQRDQGGSNNWGEMTKLTASDGAVSDYFGQSVSISGDVAIVGAWSDDDNGGNSGSAYVYQRNLGGADNWGELNKLTAVDGARFDQLGYCVSISGDVAVVGAYLTDDKGTDSGSAYFYDLSCGNGQIDGLEACDDRNNADGDGCSCPCRVEVGYICDVSEPTVCTWVCGNGFIDAHEPCDDGNSTGGDGCSPTCAVEDGYTCDAHEPTVCIDIDECHLGTDDCLAGETCTNTLGGFVCGCRSPEQKVTPIDGRTEYFGDAVSISGDVAIVGAWADDGNGYNSGAAYIYQRNQGCAKNWVEVTKLTASDGAAVDLFGDSVSISGDVAIVGARLDDDNGTDSGSAFIYQRNQGGANNWGEVAKLTASDGAADDYFSESVSISGDVAIVGTSRGDDNGSSSGSAYIYQRDQGGENNWGEVIELTASDSASVDRFGWSVSVSGDVAIVGAWSDDDDGDSSGSAYIFRRNQGGANNWGEVTKLTASDAAAKDRFGYSVSIFGDTAIVGASQDDDDGDSSGSAYIYRRGQGGVDNWGEAAKLTASDGATEDAFGSAVAISDDVAIVGAPGDDENGSISGSVYIYKRHQSGANKWGEVTKLTASDGVALDYFGRSVSIYRDVTIVGVLGVGDPPTASGSAYFYDLSCGNGLIDGIEACDDGDNNDGDGCSCTCTLEDGYICDAAEPTVCNLMCGNGLSCGDYDEDSDVDWDDYTVLVRCLYGPEVPPSPDSPLTADGCLDAFDSDFDGDIDEVDVANFTIDFSP